MFSYKLVKFKIKRPFADHRRHKHFQTRYLDATFEVFTGMVLKIENFWDVTQCRWVNDSRRFGGPLRPLFSKGQGIQDYWKRPTASKSNKAVLRIRRP